MRQIVPSSLAVVLALAVPARAAEFLPGWTTEGVWDSNVFRSLDEDQFGRKIPKEDDFSVRAGPDLRVREQQGDLTYDLGYRLRYEEFARLDGISSFDHFANASAEWAVTDRTSIFASDDFGYSNSLAGLFQILGAQANPIVRGVRQRITTNSASGGVRHRIGPLWELTLSGENDFYDYGDASGQQSVATIGTMQLTRGVTPRLVLGFGGTAQRNEESTDLGTSDTGSTFLQVFGIANYQISRTWRLAVSAGPALSMPDAQNPGSLSLGSYLQVDPASCPVRGDGVPFVPFGQLQGFPVKGPRCNPLIFGTNPPGSFALPVASPTDSDVPFVGDTGVQDSLTYFARIQLDKQWRNWRILGSYSRSATNASGLGTSTLLDTLHSEITWTPSTRWSVSLNSTMLMQSAISEVRAQQVALRQENRLVSLCVTQDPNKSPITCSQTVVQVVPVAIPFEVSSGDKIDNPIDIRTYRVELRGERRFTKNLSASASAVWYQQTNSGEFVDNKRTEWRAVLGVTWKFDPIPL
jgi:hypothetical protein